MTPAEEDQCGYEVHVGMTAREISSDACDRPTWEDEDRCIWHAQVDGKTDAELSEFDPAAQENLDGAYLCDASVPDVDWFSGTSMVAANLTGADVRECDFSDTDLTLATLTDVSAIATDFSNANLEGAIFTNSDLRLATLTGARLHDTVLTDMHIGSGTTMGGSTVYDDEDSPPELTDEHPLEAAAWVYRQLRELYKENALPQLARRSYFLEKDARRRLAWNEWNYPRIAKMELSRLVMRYGDSPYRVLATSLVVIVLFALIFPLTGGIEEIDGGSSIAYTVENPEDVPQWWLVQVLMKSLYFSIVTFATLGYGDIQPIGTLARMLAGLEAVLGALLAALLVFVLSRIVTW